MRATIAAAPFLVAAIAGCNHDPVPFNNDDLGGLDLAKAPPDLLTPVCRTHQILSVPLDDIQGYYPAAYLERSLRVRVSFSLRQGCDVPGDVNVRVMPGNATDFAVITVRTWRGSNDCGAPISASRTITLGPKDGLSSPNLLITDGAPGGTKMLRMNIGSLAAPDCAVKVKNNLSCTGDCQCVDPNARCLQVTMDGWFGCVVPCSEDADCWAMKAAGNVCQDGVCTTCKSECCGAPSGACPFGQQCVDEMDSLGCRPGAALLGGSCTCDSECGPGRLCDQAHACFVPCTTAADCGAPATMCDGGRCR